MSAKYKTNRALVFNIGLWITLGCATLLAGRGSSIAAAQSPLTTPVTATPVISPAGGSFTSAQTVTIKDATAGATIYYTTNGTTPTTSSTKYTAAFKVSTSETVSAMAAATGDANSAVATAKFTFPKPVTATPVISPAGGSFTSAQTVTIKDATAGATIYYTTNGTTPTTSSTKYTAAFKVSTSETVSAMAAATGDANSAVATAKFTFPKPVTATPVISPAGGSFTSAQTVTIKDATAGATIYYTTNGTTPTSSSTRYTAAFKVSISETISAMAVASGDAESAVATAKFTLPKPVTATPVISPASGAFTSAQTVKIIDATAGAKIYYTTDGSTPTTSSNVYKAPFSISTNQTINAMALAGGYANSADASASYTFSTDYGTIVNVQYPASTTLDSYKFQIKNAASGMVLGIAEQSQKAGASVVQEANTGSADSMWHFLQQYIGPNGGDYRTNIENLLTHQVIAFSAVAPQWGVTDPNAFASGAQALQFSNTANDDQSWGLYLLADGNYLLKNHASGLYLQDEGSDMTAAAKIDQGARPNEPGSAGCTCQEWTLVNTNTPAYPAPMTVLGGGVSVHDPYMLQDQSHTYWLYGTHNSLAQSTDLKYFTSFSPDIQPQPSWWTTIFAPSQGSPDMWAPSLLYANGTYYQYYAQPVAPDYVGGEAVIALATSKNPNGPWTDKGVIISSWSNNTPPTIPGFGFSNSTTYNAIDPAPFIDASGKWWLVFGSWFDGTHIVALNPQNGLLLNPNQSDPQNVTPIETNIAWRWWGEEGPFIYPHVVNGTQYYYYFAPINICCNPTAEYRIVYGRSTSPTGPYVDRGGVPLYSAGGGGGGTILLSAHGHIVGPGGQSLFTDTGTDGTQSIPTLVYHYYDGDGNGWPKLGINRIGFTDDGWPYVQ